MKKPVKAKMPAEANRSDYVQWLSELKLRYRNQQLKASVMVNQAMLIFYWNLGKDIADHQFANTYGSGFFRNSVPICGMNFRMPKDFLRRTYGISSVFMIYTVHFFRTNHCWPATYKIPPSLWENCRGQRGNLTDGIYSWFRGVTTSLSWTSASPLQIKHFFISGKSQNITGHAAS